MIQSFEMRTMQEPVLVERKPIPGLMWDCKNCGHRITDVVMSAFKFDFGCPKCKNSFGNFRPIEEVYKGKRYLGMAWE